MWWNRNRSRCSGSCKTVCERKYRTLIIRDYRNANIHIFRQKRKEMSKKYKIIYFFGKKFCGNDCNYYF